MITIKKGRRYRHRDGAITARLQPVDSKGYVFAEDGSGDMFERDGLYIGPHRHLDLVAEYVRRPVRVISEIEE